MDGALTLVMRYRKGDRCMIRGDISAAIEIDCMGNGFVPRERSIGKWFPEGVSAIQRGPSRLSELKGITGRITV